jgi:hypothetical protein
VRIPLLLGLSALLLVPTARALTYAEFVACVSASGQATVCQLNAGTYPVSATISIGRSNFTIEGTIVNAARATTLERASGFKGALLQDAEAAGATLKSITIRDLIINGNRAHNALAYNDYNPEVSIFAVDGLLVVNSAFNNSPNIGLALYGAGTANVVVNSCTFTDPVIYGLWSDATGDNGNITYSDCAKEKFVNNVIVANSQFTDAGEPAILGEMTNLQIMDNVFTNNHSHSIPFDDDGGQIDLTVCTQNAVIFNNTFQNGSASPNGHVADGVELHGTNIALINNTVKNNTGGGINMDGVQNIFIANWNPDTGNFANAHSGIEIAHSSATFRPTEWITIDDAYSTGNEQWGIWSDTSNTTPAQPVNHLTVESTCLSSDTLGPTYLKNLGSDVTLKSNTTSGCAPK